ncbi:MAG: hypothetical protein AAEJ04_07210 [Planctomycetota bacterium]
MKNSKDSTQDFADPEKNSSEPLHSLMWRQLGFEDQFGVSFPESSQDQNQSFTGEEEFESDFTNLP